MKIKLLFLFCFWSQILFSQKLEQNLIGLNTINDKYIDSIYIKNKIIVLNFWFPMCAPCVKEIPYLNQTLKHFENREDIVFLAVSIAGVKEYLLKFRKRKNFRYEIIENGQILATKFNIEEYPTNVVINKKGEITFIESGYKENIREILIEEIEKNLKE